MEELTWENIVKAQRSSRAVAYERYISAVGHLLSSPEPRKKALVAKANGELARLKDVQPGAVHQNSTLASISVQYANEEYIGEELMPTATVGKKSDVYFKYDKRSRLAYPDDALGPRGDANEISDGRSQESYNCITRGLQNYVDAETLENQDAPLNEMVDLVEALAEGRAFKKEQRIANALTTPASFGSNTTAIAAASRWDSIGGGNPIKDLQDGIKEIWSGRGPSELVGYCSYDAALVLSRHPAILDLFKYGGTAPGLATPSMIAGFFGLKRILVGKARHDTANEGQAASYARMWGTSNFGVARVARRPAIRTASFGYVFQHGPVVTTQWFDQKPGKHGGYFAKLAYSEDFKIVAPDTGFLWTTVIG